MQRALALSDVYRDHAHVVLRRARAILRNDADAEEVMQDLFVSLVDRPQQYEGKSSVTTWLYAATTNLCLNRLRDQRNRWRLQDRFIRPAAQDRVHEATNETVVMVQQLLALLPRELAEVAVYYYIDEMTRAEVAKLLGVSLRQVGVLLERFHDRAKKAQARKMR